MIEEPTKEDLERGAEKDMDILSWHPRDSALAFLFVKTLPAWIRRAVAAEKKVKELEELLEAVSSRE